MLIAAIAELGFVASSRLIPTPVGLVLNEVLAPLLAVYLVTVFAGVALNPPRRLARFVVGRLPTALGVALLELLVIVVIAFFVFLILGIVGGVPIPRAGTTPAPLSAAQNELVLGAFVVFTAPFLGRWLCAVPLVVVRRNGPREALRGSWAATRGSTWRCAGLVLVPTLPALLVPALPNAVQLPALFVAWLTGSIVHAALDVAVFRQLCPDLQQSHPIDDVGRTQFEADAAVLASQGYVVASSEDIDGVRSITFSRSLPTGSTDVSGPGRWVTPIAGTLILVILIGFVAVALSAPSGGPALVHPGDVYSAGCSGCTAPAFTLAQFQAAADVLRPALAAAGPPTRVDPSALTTRTGGDPAAEVFAWTPGNGWFTLHGAPAGSTITRVEVLLGGYVQDGSTDVLVELDGRTDSALDYKIDGTTMQKIADALGMPTPSP